MIRLRVVAVLASAGILAGLASCGKQGPLQPTFHATGKPATLSAWNLFDIRGGQLVLADRVTPYDLNSPLFSDYAHKLRTVWLPDGEPARYSEDETFAFPVGTIISKTFYYPSARSATPGVVAVRLADDTSDQRIAEGFDLDQVRLIETRLLVRRDEGWVALPYVWNDAQDDAVLKRAGDLQSLQLVNADDDATPFAYVVPNANQCAGCHATNATTRAIMPIGPKARHLNKDYIYADGVENQLSRWQSLGMLDGSFELSKVQKNAVWDDPSADLNARARAYLDINCAHCHNEVGPADTSGLHLEASTPMGVHLGLCKLPIAAGTGTGNRKFDIVPGKPDESIFTFRMASTNPAVMMPELGRSLMHQDGVALISEWIGAMAGGCGEPQARK
ncbi:MAG: SO2930 family diheme c-type cytochrome [Pseudomonadota bacterium]